MFGPLNLGSQLHEWSLTELQPPRPTPKTGRESPEQFRKRTGRCPPDMHWDGQACVPVRQLKTKPQEKPAPAGPARPRPPRPGEPGAPKPPEVVKEPPAPVPEPARAEPAAPAAPKPAMSFRDYAAKKWQDAKASLSKLPETLRTLPKKAGEWLGRAGERTQAFFTDRKYRHATVRAVGETLRELPRDVYDKAVHVAKHEAHEFKAAGRALRSLAKGGKLQERDWDALAAVTKHLALTTAAAAATASGIGIASALGKGLAKGFAAKVAGKVTEKLHAGEELSHLTHFFEAADDEERQEDEAMAYVAQLVARELAAELERGISDDMLEQIAGDAADEEEVDQKRQQEWMRMRPPLALGSQLFEWSLTEKPKRKKPKDRKSEEAPDQYKKRVGRCPPGYVVDPETDKCRPSEEPTTAPEPQTEPEKPTPAAAAPAAPTTEPTAPKTPPKKATPRPGEPGAPAKPVTVKEPGDLTDPKTGEAVKPMTPTDVQAFVVGADASPTEFRRRVAENPMELGRAAAADPSVVDQVRDRVKFDAKWTKQPLSKRERNIIQQLAKQHGFDADNIVRQFDQSEPEALDDETLANLQNTEAGQATSAEDAADRLKKKEADKARKKAKDAGKSDEEAEAAAIQAMKKADAFFGEMVTMFASGALLAAPLLLFLPAGPVLVGGGALMMVSHALGLSPVARRADARG